MEPVSGVLLAPTDRSPNLWTDVLRQQLVRVELRETTLTPENDTDRVRQAAAAAQREWAQYRHAPPPYGQPDQYGYTSTVPPLSADEAARVFGQRYGGTWRPVQW